MEAAKDDYRIRCEELDKELVEARSQNEELTSLADEAQSLKDEMDVLRWGAAVGPSDWVALKGGAELKVGPVLSQHVVDFGKFGMLSKLE